MQTFIVEWDESEGPAASWVDSVEERDILVIELAKEGKSPAWAEEGIK
ncbi:MAG: hypothetical protein LC778_10375 [Acidobacteria bacterium]|nr:hypothetical protein [Acidobacteriota bacterium]